MSSKGSPGLGLTKALHLRLSPQAMRALEQKALKAGLKASTWARLELYKSLGLVDG